MGLDRVWQEIFARRERRVTGGEETERFKNGPALTDFPELADRGLKTSGATPKAAPLIVPLSGPHVTH